MLDQVLIFELQNNNATAFESIAAMFFLFFGFGLIVFSISRYFLEVRPQEKENHEYEDYLNHEDASGDDEEFHL